MFVVMNKDSWARLPEDIQKTIREINEEWIVRHGKKWDEMDADGEKYVLSLGKTVSQITPEENERFKELVKTRLAENVCSLIVARRPCIIALAKIKSYSEEQK